MLEAEGLVRRFPGLSYFVLLRSAPGDQPGELVLELSDLPALQDLSGAQPKREQGPHENVKTSGCAARDSNPEPAD